MPLLGEHRLTGTLVAKAYGGEGQGCARSVIIGQELGGVIPSLAAFRSVNGNFVVKPVEEFGTRNLVAHLEGPQPNGSSPAGPARAGSL